MAACDTIRCDYATTQTRQPQLGITSELIRNVVIVSKLCRRALRSPQPYRIDPADMDTAQVMQAQLKALVEQEMLARQTEARRCAIALPFLDPRPIGF